MNASDRLWSLPLRVRLVAGFSAAMLVLLTVVGAFVYWRVEYALDRGLDTELDSAQTVIAPLVGADGSVASHAAADATGTGWQVLDATGAVLDFGGPTPSTALVAAAVLSGVDASGSTVDVGTLLPVTAAPYRVEVRSLPRSAPAGAAYLLVAVRRDHRDEALRELLLQMTLAGLGALVVASLVGDLLARMALRPVERYRRRAVEISHGAAQLRLDVPPDRDDEVTRLGHTLNEMLANLEESLDRERQFVGDASHELRTPLTLLSSRIQVARRRERTTAEHEQVLDELDVDVARLVALADQLLELDRELAAGPGAGDGPLAVTDLADVVEVVVDRWQTARPEGADDVTLRVQSQPIGVRVERPALERVVTNLLTNALVHGAPPVVVVVRREAGRAILEVSDGGPGMSPELLVQATRRFSRAPEARARPGSGLGLALVEQLVLRARGEVRLCHDGTHASTGLSTDVACAHADRMTVTVLLPVGDDSLG